MNNNDKSSHLSEKNYIILQIKISLLGQTSIKCESVKAIVSCEKKWTKKIRSLYLQVKMHERNRQKGLKTFFTKGLSYGSALKATVSKIVQTILIFFSYCAEREFCTFKFFRIKTSKTPLSIRVGLRCRKTEIVYDLFSIL